MGVRDALKALRGGKTEVPQAPRNMQGEIGYTGNLIWSGLPMDEYNSDLAFPKNVLIYDQMRRSDGQVAAVMNAMKLPIRSTKWFLEPGDVGKKADEKQAQQIADFVEWNLFEQMKFSWDDHLREALLMLDFGFSVFEKVYRMDEYEGRPVVILDKYAPRVAHSIWRFPQSEQDGSIVAVQQLNYYTGGLYDLPLNKLRLYTHNREGDNPIGISALRPAYKHWYIKSALERIVAVGVEKALVGTPYATLPKGTSEEDRKKVLDALTAMRVAEEAGATFPEGVVVNVLEGKSSAVNAMPFLEYQDTQIARSLLGQFINLGTMSSASGGSYALGNTMVGLFIKNLESIASYIASEVQRDIEQLVEWNFGADAPVPRLKYGTISVDSAAEKLTAIAAAGSGHLINPDEELENTLRALIGVPPISKQVLDNQLVLPANRYEPEIIPDGKLTPKMIADAQAASAQAKAPGTVAGAKPVAAPKGQQPVQAVDPQTGITFASQDGQQPPQNGQQRRPLTPHEQQVELDKLEAYWTAAEAAMLVELQHHMHHVADDFYKQMQEVLGGLSTQAAIRKVSSLKIGDDKAYADAVQTQLERVAEHGMRMVTKELGVSSQLALPRELQVAFESKAKTLASIQTGKLLNSAQLAALQSLERGGNVEHAIAAAKDAGEQYIDGHDLVLSANVSVSEAMHLGRGAEAAKQGVQGAQWSAILDSKTCELCASLDGKLIRADNPDFDVFRPPLHYHCRCFLAYIGSDNTGEHWDWKTPDPALVKKYATFVH